MEKISIPWKTAKDTWNSSLLKKIKFWDDGTLKLPERWRRYWNKTVTALFNKVTDKNENIFYFYLKPNEFFDQSNMFLILLRAFSTSFKDAVFFLNSGDFSVLSCSGVAFVLLFLGLVRPHRKVCQSPALSEWAGSPCCGCRVMEKTEHLMLQCTRGAPESGTL